MIKRDLDRASKITLRITITGGELEREILPFGAADRAMMVPMLNAVGNAAEVKGVRALSCEDGLPLPSFHISKADGTSSL